MDDLDDVLFQLEEVVRTFVHFFPYWEMADDDMDIVRMVLILQSKRPLSAGEYFLLEKFFEFAVVLYGESTTH